MSLDNVGLSTLDLTLAKGMRPKACANKIFAAYPEAASLNYSYRPNTALVGTSPFMALGGTTFPIYGNFKPASSPIDDYGQRSPNLCSSRKHELQYFLYDATPNSPM